MPQRIQTFMQPQRPAHETHVGPEKTRQETPKAHKSVALKQGSMGNRALSRMMYAAPPSSGELSNIQRDVPATTSEGAESATLQDTHRAQLRTQRFEQANASYSRGDYVTAARQFTVLIEQEGGTMDAQARASLTYNIGQCNLRLGRYASALHYFREAQQSGALPDSRTSQLEENLARCRRHVGVETNAEGEVEALTVEQSRARFESGARMYSQGNYQGAIIVWTQIIDAGNLEDSVRKNLLFNLGQANYRLRRYATAIPFYEQARTLGLTDHLTVLEERLTECRREIGTPMTDGGTVLSLLDEAARDKFFAGNTAYSAGDFAASRARFLEALELTTNAGTRGPLHYNIAQSCYRMGNYAEAAEHYREALAAGGINETVARDRLAECEARLSGEPTETAH
ncbi:MAG: tetratricopeptide repeat protein [Pleurocapsa minor GSE-CHR-MK-17-07R]|jgi:tetratricopeptide (TPR) repeat protein|nr:tetratricopeptide repeat protein [Pleurocapsa minor GSE-CHR-MK 17-07R]